MQFENKLEIKKKNVYFLISRWHFFTGIQTETLFPRLLYLTATDEHNSAFEIVH